MNNGLSPQREILSVTDLNRRARNLLESEFKQVWVEGEISNFSRPASGHWYFTLKDNGAQVRCAMFTNRNRSLRIQVQNGMHVILRAKVSLYEGRGDYQLIAENLIDAGEGRLQREFEELKRSLAAQGLFSEQHKQPLPVLPSHIGVVTSPTGAAIRDILTVLKRRFPGIPVSVIPAAVQGKGAAAQIVGAIKLAQSLQDSEHPIDALIVGRGGGSLEDLWPFNEEAVARAIFDCTIPIVSAVGHEVDFTIADFVADVRAATPSAAAELLSPDRDEWQRSVKKHQRSLVDNLQRRLFNASQQLNHLLKRMRHPGQQLQEQAQRLDDIEARFTLAISHQLKLQKSQLETLSATLSQHQPSHQINHLNMHNQQLSQRLQNAMKHTLENFQHRLKSNGLALHTLSPLQTLARGYTITKDPQGRIIRDSSAVQIGDKIITQLGHGQLTSAVEAINND
ncbi:MAG: exodeoxyribonuclease VII large subunit [Pseudomonadales bacterium]